MKNLINSVYVMLVRPLPAFPLTPACHEVRLPAQEFIIYIVKYGCHHSWRSDQEIEIINEKSILKINQGTFQIL